MSTALILAGDNRVALSEQAAVLKAEALERAALIGTVTNAEQNEYAAKVQRDLQAVVKAVEADRWRVKEPFLDMGRKIDATAREFVMELEEEYLRIGECCQEFAARERERFLVERRRVQEEQERILREQRKAEEEARAKAEAEAAAARAKAATEIALANSLSERIAAEKRAEAERIAAQKRAEEQAKLIAERAAQELESVKPAALPQKADGQVVKHVWRFEVTDVWLLARTSPGLVRIEPNRSEINEVISRLAAAGEPKIPGLRIWNEVQVTARAVKPKTIDV